MKSAIVVAFLCSATILFFVATCSALEEESELERHRDTTWICRAGLTLVALALTVDRIWPG